MKKIVALLLAVLMVFGLTACSSGTDSEVTTAAPDAPTEAPDPAASEASAAPDASKVLNIYGIYKSESTYFVNEAASIEKTLNEKAKEYGFTVTWHFNNCDGDPEKYMTLIDTAIADKADAIVTCIPDQTMSQSVVDKCNEAGVTIVAVDDGLVNDAGEKIAPWFGIDAYNIGYSAGEWMANYAKENNLLEDETVGLLYMTMSTVSSCVPRTEGEKQAWADILGDALSDRTYEADYVSMSEEAYNSASAVVTAHPEIKTWLVMTPSENGVLGAGAVLEEAGLDGTSCIIALGCDEMSTQWSDGNYSVCRASAYFSGKVVGREAAIALVEYLINGTELPKEYATPAVIVTPDNYTDYVL